MHESISLENKIPQEAPQGFSFVSDLNRSYGTHNPETVNDFEEKGLTPPNPGECSQNNGVLVCVDGEGRLSAMLPIEDPNRKEDRRARFEKGIEDLKSMGYKEANFSVPVF